MRRILLFLILPFAVCGAHAQDLSEFTIPRPEVMDPATDAVRADSARLRQERKAVLLTALGMVPNRLSTQTVITLYWDGDPGDVWGRYLDRVQTARKEVEDKYYDKRTRVMTDTLAVGDLRYTAGQVDGMSEAELAAFQQQAIDEGLGEYGLTLSELQGATSEEDARKLAGKIMESRYGGVNLQELQKYMGASEEERMQMTTDARQERSDKTIRTETLNYINGRIISIQQKIGEYGLKEADLFVEADRKESITLYCEATEKVIAFCNGPLLELYLDLVAMMDQGYAINQHAEFAAREELLFTPVFRAFGLAEGLKSHPTPDL